MASMKTSAAWAVVGVFVAAIFFVFRVGAREEIIIGALLPFESDVSSGAEASRAGFEMARQDFAGEPFTIVYADTKFSSTTAAREAQRLIDEGADILYSSYSAVTVGVSPISMEEKILLLYDSCNCGFAQDNPYAFQLYFDPRKECRQIAEHYKERGAQKGAFIATDVPYAKYCFEAMEDVLGKGNVFIEREGGDGFRAYKDLIPWFANQGAAFIVSVPAVRNFKDLFAANISDELPVFCYVEACLTRDVVAGTSPEALSNVTAFALRLDESFEERVRAVYPDFSNEEVLSAARAYDVVAYALSAHVRCLRTTSSCLVRELKKVTLESPAIVASGFGDDRVLDYDTLYLKQDGDALAPVSP